MIFGISPIGSYRSAFSAAFFTVLNVSRETLLLRCKAHLPAKYIETKEDVIAFLEGTLEESDPEFLPKYLVSDTL
jgi:hypothetical protein